MFAAVKYLSMMKYEVGLDCSEEMKALKARIGFDHALYKGADIDILQCSYIYALVFRDSDFQRRDADYFHDEAMAALTTRPVRHGQI